MKSNYAKIRGGRTENICAHKSTGGRQRFTGKCFAQKWKDFVYALLSFRLSPRLTIATRTLELINNIHYLIILKAFLIIFFNDFDEFSTFLCVFKGFFCKFEE